MVISYCCNIPRGNNMSCGKNWIAVTRPCVRYLVTMYSIADLRESNRRQLRPSKLATEEDSELMGGAERKGKKEVYGEKPDLVWAANDNMSVMFPSKGECLLKHVEFRMHTILLHSYRVFMVEHLHSLHLGISKIVKKTIIAYRSSDPTMSTLGHSRTNRRHLKMQKAVLRGCNAYCQQLKRIADALDWG